MVCLRRAQTAKDPNLTTCITIKLHQHSCHEANQTQLMQARGSLAVSRDVTSMEWALSSTEAHGLIPGGFSLPLYSPSHTKAFRGASN